MRKVDIMIVKQVNNLIKDYFIYLKLFITSHYINFVNISFIFKNNYIFIKFKKVK